MGSLSFQAKEFMNQELFHECVQLYEQAAKDYDWNEWDYNYYAKALKKLDRVDEAIKIGGRGLKEYPDSSLLQNDYGWNLYYKYIKGFDPNQGNENMFLKAVDYILSHTKQEKYSPYERSAWVAIEYYKKKTNVPYEKLEGYLNKLDVQLLSDIPKNMSLNGRDLEYNSEKEKWYSSKAKLLEEMGQYEACIKICDEALITIKKFHSNNDVWFKYRKALSLLGLGYDDKAEEIIKEQITHLDHWILYHVLFKIHVNRKQYEDALKYGSIAATNSIGEHKHKMEMYEKMAEILKDLGMQRESFLHVLLIVKTREENGWSIKESMTKLLEEYNKEDLDKRLLEKELKSFWDGYRFKGEDIHYGTITKIMPNGKAGFIKSDLGKDYYFSLKEIKDRKLKKEVGERVQFYARKSFDKSKGKESEEAVEIKSNH